MNLCPERWDEILRRGVKPDFNLTSLSECPVLLAWPGFSILAEFHFSHHSYDEFSFAISVKHDPIAAHYTLSSGEQ